VELNKLIVNMKVITVSGAHKGVGKTLLTELLLRNLTGFAAIKITMTDLQTSVTDDKEEVMIPGKDTFRMKRSGAEKVVWVKATEESLQEAMEHALGMVGKPKGLLIEGNSILRYLNPEIAFFVIDSTIDSMKQSRVSALKKADVCVINQKNGAKISEDTLQELNKLNPKMKIFNFDFFPVNSKDIKDSKDLINYLEKRVSD